MPWFKVDDSLAFHAKALAAGNAAMGLWVRAGSYAAQHLTDGFIRRDVARTLGTTLEARRLVDAGLWMEVEGGYYMLPAVPSAPGCPELDLWAIVREEYRRKIPDDVRLRVYERDEFRCMECAATDDLTLDHIYPWSLGGCDDEGNLRTLCRICNARKGARV